MVIAIMIVVLGLIAIKSMPIEQYPDITPPVVEVTAQYQGADALTVEQSVATPIEESVNGVSDMIYMQSTNSNDGSMSLQVSFGVGSNPDMSTVFTQNRVSSATPMLPQPVIQQGVTTQKTMTSFIMVLSLFSDGRYDENFLANYAIINMKDPISRINGVGSVQVLGGGPYAMRIWITSASRSATSRRQSASKARSFPAASSAPSRTTALRNSPIRYGCRASTVRPKSSNGSCCGPIRTVRWCDSGTSRG